jgi:predicted metalloprotease with PDZ domain
MNDYQFFAPNPLTKEFIIELKLPTQNRKEVNLFLPLWRPGRYEARNFAKKIHFFEVKNENLENLEYSKINKNTWKIKTSGEFIVVRYSYYSDALDAGNGCYLTSEIWYINPGTCLLYDLQNKNEKAKITLNHDFVGKIATSLEQIKPIFLQAKNIDELLDSPIIISNNLTNINFEVDLNKRVKLGFSKIKINIWIKNEFKLDVLKITEDFKKFILYQGKLFGSFPVCDYSFLIILPNKRVYHAVEHVKNCVVVFGPESQILSNLKSSKIAFSYEDLLIVCSHEFFHTWNVKNFRPQEILNYDYQNEQLTDLHFITEGLTSYYDELSLLRTGQISLSQYLYHFQNSFNHYYLNGKYSFLSLARSSQESWVDGYKNSIPNRANSFYIKGKLAAFILDIWIRKQTKNQKSLDHFIQELYLNFGDLKKGYSYQNIIQLVDQISGVSSQDFLNFLYKESGDITKQIEEAWKFLGFSIKFEPFNDLYTAFYGFIINENLEIVRIYPGSQAEKVFSLNDQIVAVNNQKITKNNLNELLQLNSSLSINLFRNSKLMQLNLEKNDKVIFGTCAFEILEKINPVEKENQNLWKN